jgi:hypothetical protein
MLFLTDAVVEIVVATWRLPELMESVASALADYSHLVAAAAHADLSI